MDPESVAHPSAGPLDAVATLAWMREHGTLLRELIAEETPEGDAPPAGDGAIRAQLRFLAEAIAATAAPPLAEPLQGFANLLPIRFEEDHHLFEQHVETGAGAIALEEHLQHRTSPGRDPSLDAGLDRRVRITGWIQLFLVALEERLGPQADGLGAAVTAELDARHRELARVILSLDRHAQAALRRSLPEAPSAAVVDEVGQAAVVQGHVRVLVEALATVLARSAEG